MNLLPLQVSLLLFILKPTEGYNDVSNSSYPNIPSGNLMEVCFQVKVIYDSKFKQHSLSLGKTPEEFVKEIFVKANTIASLPGLDQDLRYVLHPKIHYYGDDMIPYRSNYSFWLEQKPRDKWPSFDLYQKQPDIDHFLLLTYNNRNYWWTFDSPCTPSMSGLRDLDYFPYGRTSIISEGYKDAYQAARILIAQTMFTLWSIEGFHYFGEVFDYDGFGRLNVTPKQIDGKNCTGIGGVMDNVDFPGVFSDVPPTQWSECSKLFMTRAMNYKFNCHDFTCKCG